MNLKNNSIQEIFSQILQEVEKHSKVIIFTHVNPDGDTIGTAIALKQLLLLNTKQKEVFIIGDHFPRNLKWLGQNDLLSDKDFSDALAILVDCSNLKRCYDQRIKNCVKIIKIDHHHPEENHWFLKIDGDFWPAAGQILGELILDLNLKFNFKALESLYVAIWTDTSGLVERLPSVRTKEVISFLEKNGVKRQTIIKKLSFSKETQTKINSLVANASHSPKLTFKINKEVVPNDIYRSATELFFKKYDSQYYLFAILQENLSIRVGLRSKQKDVSEIAKEFGGGGHRTSAGTIVKSWQEVKKIIAKIISFTK